MRSLPFAYDELVRGCLEILRDDTRRKELENRGFEYFSRRNASQILGRVLGAPEMKDEFDREKNFGGCI
jgi:hypothetical protein